MSHQKWAKLAAHQQEKEIASISTHLKLLWNSERAASNLSEAQAQDKGLISKSLTSHEPPAVAALMARMNYLPVRDS